MSSRSDSFARAFVLAAWLAPAAARAQDYPEPVIQWGVEPDTTCEDVARAVYGDPSHVRLVSRYNPGACTRGAPLKPGITLVLPARVTPTPTARIDWLRQEVRMRPAGGGWSPA